MSELKAGLFYRRKDGVEIDLAATSREQWVVLINEKGDFFLQRYFGGLIDETHRPMQADEATVALAAIGQGFEPPRGLRRRDTPVR